MIKNLTTNFCRLLTTSTLASEVTGKNVLHRTRARIVAATIVQRFPVITTEMNDIEKRYADLMDKRNVEKSHLSDHELRHIKDLANARKKKDNKDDESLLLETASDYEDKRLKLLNEFKAGSREPSKQDKLNFKSMNRLMDKKIFLLIKDKNSGHWIFPSVSWREGENLKQTASRSLQGLTMKVQFLGNAPCGLYKIDDGNEKEKVHTYFFKADYKGDEKVPSYGDHEHIWITKSELQNFIKNDKYYEATEEFLLDF